MLTFQPPFWLQNRHLQTIIASSGWRHVWIRHEANNLLTQSEALVLHSSKGVRLKAQVAIPHAGNDKMAVIFHGWEGSADSSYVLSAGQSYLNRGFSVCRLNLRDHGDTYHLNRQPFNSVRLDEICEALTNLCQRYPCKTLHLVGFSLGGNFVLRLSAQARIQHLPLALTVAICPAIDPIHSSDTIEQGSWLYHNYFVRKWRHSLLRKYQYFPEIMRSHHDLEHKTLGEMNRVFVPLHTDYSTAESYLAAYRVSQPVIDAIRTPCHVIYADDDPIIDASDLDRLQATEWVKFEVQEHGGHCAFLRNSHLQSWIGARLDALIAPQ